MQEIIDDNKSDITPGATNTDYFNKKIKECEIVLDRISEALISLDYDGNILYLHTSETKDLFAQLLNQVTNKNLWETFPILKNTELELYYKKAAIEKKPVNFIHYEVYSGTEKWFKISLFPLKDCINVYFVY